MNQIVKLSRFTIATLLLICLKMTSTTASASGIALNDGWKIQSSEQTDLQGAEISSSSFNPHDWLNASVPVTVVDALLQNGPLTDPYFGMNLRSTPGANYPINENFCSSPMPDGSPFKASWWYVKNFAFPAPMPGSRVFLHFNGINYSADLWMNGQKIAARSEFVGTFRQFDFDITSFLSSSGQNTIALEMLAPLPDDLAGTWVDWNPVPGDKNLGIWRDVYLTQTGEITLQAPQVVTTVNLPKDSAELILRTQVTNHLNVASVAHVDVQIEGEDLPIEVQTDVSLKGGETRQITFSSARFPALHIQKPHLWWPYQMGKPYLHRATLSVESGGVKSDNASFRFGIRQITSELSAATGDVQARLFRINGVPLMIRGGGWAPDMMLRSQPARELQELKYVVDLGLNTIRMEGKFESDHFLDLCDEMGILTIPGWSCCTRWENGAKWGDKDFQIAGASMHDQLRRHINHPSTLAFLYGSDIAAPAPVESMYLDILKQENWPNPSVASAADDTTQVGRTGVKMTGPYDYVPPSYWYVDENNGGAFGFNTETSMGPAVPPIESLRAMIPADHLWPIDDAWNFHGGIDHFQQITYFTEGLNRRYGASANVEEYARKAQVLAYEGHRSMFEAYTREKYIRTTGIVQWMLNNAWPSMIWHLYDYYLRPGGSYFGAKKALEPLHLQYSYDDQSIVAVNSSYQAHDGMFAHARLLNFDLKPQWEQTVGITLPADSSTRILTLPSVANLSTTYFLDLELKDSAGTLVSKNFYWLSTQKEVFDWDKTDFTRTPVKVDGDLTALNQLPQANIQVQVIENGKGRAKILVSNPSSNLAFFVRFKAMSSADGADAQEILPVLWSDNYISLLPGDSRTIEVATETDGALAMSYEGWNVPASHAF